MKNPYRIEHPYPVGRRNPRITIPTRPPQIATRMFGMHPVHRIPILKRKWDQNIPSSSYRGCWNVLIGEATKWALWGSTKSREGSTKSRVSTKFRDFCFNRAHGGFVGWCPLTLRKSINYDHYLTYYWKKIITLHTLKLFLCIMKIVWRQS